KSSLSVPGAADQSQKLETLIGEQLVGCGFNEILNNSLTKVSYYDSLNKYTEETCVKIMNPLSNDLGMMRQTLLFGGLESISYNVNRRNANLRFFEFGNCYHFNPAKADGEQPIKAYTEEYHLGLWVTGKRVEGSWAHADEKSSFYELHAYVQNIFARLGVPAGLLVTEKSDNNIYSSALVIKNRGGKLIAELGLVSEAMKKRFDLTSDVYFADIHWTNLMKCLRKGDVQFEEISKFPAVSRDLALLLDKEVEFAQVEQVAKQTEKKLLKKVELFDVYEGKNLPAGKKSYAVNFILQDEQSTLNDKQIDAIMKKLIANLTTKLGAELR
ncbi:MAG: phenylalanine--tRNA ligase subunit beta, partial [Prevotella sp.]|nr:phenylalanine--tRNA ligase subunit beta [Prevotella sp.]